jgi:putative peptidoglycan lipid II flippase
MRQRLPRILIAAAVMGVVLWWVTVLLTPFLGTPGMRSPALLLLILSGIASYFGAGFLIGAFRMADFRAALRRPARAKTAG